MATKWGICGAGRISNDFVTAVKSLPTSEHLVEAVAARSETAAKEFGEKHGISRCYGSYAELIADPDVHVVYIGVINPQHYELAKKAILHGKHVLCEKPMCMNPAETKDLIELAGKSDVFLMEVRRTKK
jgi:dihydrodiol dehydrogenase / D-xylose 1-dehydrogenase (NADP)